MATSKKQLRINAALCFIVCIACGFGGFAALFRGAILGVALGSSILCFTLFFAFFNKAWAFWLESEKAAPRGAP